MTDDRSIREEKALDQDAGNQRVGDKDEKNNESAPEGAFALGFFRHVYQPSRDSSFYAVRPEEPAHRAAGDRRNDTRVVG
jgi:hypothetical protein